VCFLGGRNLNLYSVGLRALIRRNAKNESILLPTPKLIAVNIPICLYCAAMKCQNWARGRGRALYITRYPQVIQRRLLV
jgi:hypothetical protein